MYLRNIYPNMVVFGLEWSIFEADSEYELENIDVQFFFSYIECMPCMERQSIIKFLHFWPQKAFKI